MSNFERRRSEGLSVETRSIDGEQRTLIQGTAIVFNSLSREMSGFYERLAPTCLDRFFENHRAIGNGVPDIAALWNHDPGAILGRTPKTLQVQKDARGVHFTLDPPKSMPQILESVQRRDCRGCSFAFTVAKEGEDWHVDDEGRSIRTINEIDDFLELSLVLSPAYEATELGVAQRSFELFRDQREQRKAKYRQFKDFLEKCRGAREKRANL